MVQGRRRLDGEIRLAFVDRLIGRSRGARLRCRQSGAVKNIDETKRRKAERVYDYEALLIEGVYPGADRRRDPFAIVKKIAAGFLNPAGVAQHARGMHDRID